MRRASRIASCRRYEAAMCPVTQSVELASSDEALIQLSRERVRRSASRRCGAFAAIMSARMCSKSERTRGLAQAQRIGARVSCADLERALQAQDLQCDDSVRGRGQRCAGDSIAVQRTHSRVHRSDRAKSAAARSKAGWYRYSTTMPVSLVSTSGCIWSTRSRRTIRPVRWIHTAEHDRNRGGEPGSVRHWLGIGFADQRVGYCLADPRHDGVVPAGLMHPRRIRDGVHRWGKRWRKSVGIPYGRGWEIFDPRYLGKPMVYCGTVGRMPVMAAGRPTHEKSVRAGRSHRDVRRKDRQRRYPWGDVFVGGAG